MISRFTSAAAAVLFACLAASAQAASPLSTATGTHNGRGLAPANPNQFASEADARSHCASDAVVWLNTKSGVYHLQGSPAFGHTKHGAFMCRADADNAGRYRLAKHEARMQGNADRNPPARSGSSMSR